MITCRTALTLIGATIASPALANRPQIYKGNNNVAVNGYDVVGCFTEASPQTYAPRNIALADGFWPSLHA